MSTVRLQARPNMQEHDAHATNADLPATLRNHSSSNGGTLFRRTLAAAWTHHQADANRKELAR